MTKGESELSMTITESELGTTGKVLSKLCTLTKVASQVFRTPTLGMTTKVE